MESLTWVKWSTFIKTIAMMEVYFLWTLEMLVVMLNKHWKIAASLYQQVCDFDSILSYYIFHYNLFVELFIWPTISDTLMDKTYRWGTVK